MAKPLIMNNAHRAQKYATVYIKKALMEEAKLLDLNLKSLVKDKLQETYVKNVRESYTPRTTRGQEIVEYNKDPYKTHRKKLTYRHTGIFANSIYTKVDGQNIKVMIRDQKYPGFASTTEVYKWLTEGTNGSSKAYPYLSENGVKWSRNFAIPAHLFEEHTKLQMEGFLDSVADDLKNSSYRTIRDKYYKYAK